MAKFVKFAIQKAAESEPTRFAWIKASDIIVFQSNKYDEKPKNSNTAVKKDGCVIMTPYNATYVAHTYTEVVTLINGNGVELNVS